jgi:hypothetical protein
MLTSESPQEKKISVWLRVLALVVLLAAILFVSTAQPTGNDFWLQAKIGQIIWDTHMIPRTLLFPFTEVAEQTFNAHEWLTSIGFGLLVRAVGVDGLTLVLSVLGVGYFLVVTLLGYERGQGNLPAALIGGLAAIVTENYRHVLRPELATLFIMAFYWLLLERLRKGPSIALALASLLLVVVWANSHGSFILAPVLAGLYAAGAWADQLWQSRQMVKPSREAWFFGLLSALVWVACLINPFGIEMLQFVFSFGRSKELQSSVTEWLPTLDRRILQLPTIWAFGSIWLATVVTMLWHRKKVPGRDWLIFMFFTWLSLRAIRFPVYGGLVSAYLTTPLIAPTLHSLRRQNWVYASLAMIGVATIALALKFQNLQGTSPDKLNAHKLSDAMVSALQDERRHGNVLNTMELGAELIYWAYPRLRPASDARVDSYGFEYLKFQSAVLLDNTLLSEFVARYDVRYMLLDIRRFAQLAKTDAWTQHNWEPILMDSRAVFLRRSDVPD